MGRLWLSGRQPVSFGVSYKPGVGDVRESPANAEVAVIVTAHPSVDRARIAEQAAAVVDLRGGLRGAAVGSIVGL